MLILISVQVSRADDTTHMHPRVLSDEARGEEDSKRPTISSRFHAVLGQSRPTFTPAFGSMEPNVRQRFRSPSPS